MKHGFIGSAALAIGLIVLTIWARTAIRSGIPEEWPPALVSGQLLAIGGWLLLIGLGAALLWRKMRATKLFRTGECLHARADIVPVAGYVLVAVGATAICWAAVFDLLWGDGDRALIPAVAAPFLLAMWLLVSVSGLAGRIWWPGIRADPEWVVVSGIFERTTFRAGQVRFEADNGGTTARGTPHRRERSPFGWLLRYRGHTITLPTIRLRDEALAVLNAERGLGPQINDPYIVVPPR